LVEIILNEIILNTAQNGKEIEIIKKKLIDKENWDTVAGERPDIHILAPLHS